MAGGADCIGGGWRYVLVGIESFWSEDVIWALRRVVRQRRAELVLQYSIQYIESCGRTLYHEIMRCSGVRRRREGKKAVGTESSEAGSRKPGM